MTDRPATRIKKVEDKNLSLLRLAQPTMHSDLNLVDVSYDIFIKNKKDDKIQEIKEIHKMRYFFIPEMQEYFKETGFELLGVLDCNSLEKPDWDSWTCYFIAKAI